MQAVKPRILYVEGYADTLMAIALRLRMIGYEVDTADSLAGGLELARKGASTFTSWRGSCRTGGASTFAI